MKDFLVFDHQFLSKYVKVYMKQTLYITVIIQLLLIFSCVQSTTIVDEMNIQLGGVGFFFSVLCQ